MNKLITLFIAISCIACSGEKQNEQASTNKQIQHSVDGNSKSKSAENRFTKICLLKEIEHLNKIISTDEMATITGISKEQAETEYNDQISTVFYRYKWPNTFSRTITLPNSSSTADLTAEVVVNILYPEQSLKQFKHYYPTDPNSQTSDLIKANDDVEKALKGESSNSKMNERIKKMKDEGWNDDDIREAISGLGSMVTQNSAATRQISGFGERAVWNSIYREFVINDDGMTFLVQASTSEDADKDLEIAKEIARRISKACK